MKVSGENRSCTKTPFQDSPACTCKQGKPIIKYAF
jgi:hypothetical protein